MRILAIVNQKGGSGKTTSAVNLAACLAEASRRVLLVDLDPQCSATKWIGRGLDTGTGVFGVLTGQAGLAEIIRPAAGAEGVDLAPASRHLVGAERALSAEVGAERLLAEALVPVRDAYDYVLLDCPPTLGLLTVNALAAADGVLVPVEASPMALQGLADLLNTIERARARINPGLSLDGIVLCRVNGRNVADRQAVEAVKKHQAEATLSTVIRETVRLREAPSWGKPVTVSAPGSHGAQDYRVMAQELIERLERQQERRSRGGQG